MATTMNVVQSRELYSSGDEQAPKVRKPYTITKQRERWTKDEHNKFLEALKLYGRAWQRIEEHIGTKTAVQIRSHAQKFFTKVTRETATNGAGSSNSIEIPPPRPKRKPMHPYPRKLANICKKGMPVFEQDNKPCLLDPLPMGSSAMISSVTQQDNRSPSSASSVTGRDLIEPNQMNCEVPVSPVAGSSTHDRFSPVNGFSSPSSDANLNLVGSFVSVHDNGVSSPDLKSKRSSWLDQPSTFSNVDSSTSNAKEETHSEETDSGSTIKDPSTETSSTSLKLFGQTVLVNPASAITTKSGKSSFLTFQKEYSLENFTSNEVIAIEKEAYSSCEPHDSQEIESSDEAPRGFLQEEAWNLWSSTNPQMVYWLQYQQSDSDSNLDCISVAPWWALYGNFPFSFVHLSLNDPSNAQGRDGVTLYVSSDPCRSEIHAWSNNKKDKSSPLSSEATSVSDNDTIEKGSSTGQERDEDPESSGLFSRKVSFRSSGTGFLPYKRCVAETNGENMQQFDQSGEEKRIRLCI